ncbi:hypothetical protein OVA14_04235 [Agrococcus sp. SL85]|uniref:hypothetical protein n=1 Tax=Agrococcus sp. SL85 TaxID=2995141 RepID=UPI00226D0BBD|nr:hypothetical protein [Agrococcus sp. SL85]WAC66979.1 hypothetical protein OVA14_04235 [Agrococcus sp. SL85]
MTATPDASQGLQTWHLPAMRAVPALLVGLPLPFVQLHSPFVGLVALALLTGLGAAALWLGRGLVPAEARGWPAQAAGWSALAALVAVVLALLSPTETSFGLLVAAWGIGAGALELAGWWRLRRAAEPRTLRLARDWRAVGAATIILGVVFALVRDAVTLTGLLGAYAVVVGVYLALAALSARPARTTERSDA